MTARFTESDSISVFDASLLWFDKNPRQRLSYGYNDWIVLLIRDREVHDLACWLLSDIEQGLIKAVAKSWLTDISDSWKSRLGSLPGGLDPRGTKIAIKVLVKFADDRGQRPAFLAHLMTERTAPIDQEPKQAPITAIHEAISAVYDEAAGAGQKPPNVREISAPVQSRLREQGLKASARQIEELASDDRHKGRRRERGKTLASEKP